MADHDGTAPDPGWRPPWAYVPGQTPRHPEGRFDRLRAGIRADLPPAAMAAAPAWRFALAFLREGYFWEAHELLEPVWMACPQGSPDRLMVQGLIQLANAGLKRRMQRPKAAARLLGLAEGCRAQALDRAAGRPVLGAAAFAEIARGLQDSS